jgi:putative ABC transport system permease protein
VSGVRIRRRDLLDEAVAGTVARPGRLFLMAFGAALGLAAVVATLGLAQTAATQVAGRFDAIAATQVTITPRAVPGLQGATGSPGAADAAFAFLPWDAEDRVGRLNGVVHSGLISRVESPPPLRTVPVADPTGAFSRAAPVMAASPGLLDSVRGTLATGRFFDTGHDERADRVVVLGANLAARLHVNRVDNQPSLFIGERAYAVIGIVDHVARHTELLDAAIVPDGTARAVLGLDAPQQLQIDTATGAAALVGHQAPIALDPSHPDGFDASVPPTATRLRARVQSDVNALFLVLGGVALLAGAVGIANVTLLSVLERIAEIGLRRALGATRRQIAAQFVLESGLVGLIGGLVGAAGGVLITVVVSAARRWTPVLDLRLAAGAPALGVAIGLLAGAYPAWKASAIEPIAALHAGQ